jgi:O-antigen ligase
VVFGLALWRPPVSLLAVVWLAPWGERLAAVPVRATEILLFAFLAGWAVRFRKPATRDAWRHGGVVAPALAFAAVVVVSWGRLALARAPEASVGTALRLVPSDYLVTAGRDPHTAGALLLVLSAAVYVATLVLSRHDPALPRRVLFAVALSSLLAAAASVVAVPITYLTTGDFNEVLRYLVITRSRGSFHLHDVNAAGSHYILGGLLSLPFALAPGPARTWWRAGHVVLVAALWMSGSRAAWVAGALGAVSWFVVRRRAARNGQLPAVSTRALAVVAVVVLVALTASARLGSESASNGSATRSLAIRAEFLETSLRMWATSPVLGVGVGTYYDRSSEFMPPGIRALYGRENAHNYYVQVATELGVIGFVLFLWWLGAGLARVWQSAQRHASDGTLLAVICSCAAYLLTCVTGHPFLVVEAAVPFWASLGAGVALARLRDASSDR